MSKLLIHAWTVIKCENEYYLPYTHWVYLQEIVKNYDEVCLLSPVKMSTVAAKDGLLPISFNGKVKVYALPFSYSYISALRFFKHYISAYKNLKYYDHIYVRYPIPFGWLSKIFFKKKKRIIHFVGDPIDATNNNPNLSKLRRKALTTFFMPEHLAYMWACKDAEVYTNGHHIREKLIKYDVYAKALISSTLNNDDFFFEDVKEIHNGEIKLLYVGYLRRAKGVEVIVKAFKLVQEKYAKATLTIVGSGEFEMQLKELVQHLGLINSVSFEGHIDNRDKLNYILRTHHIFCFASLSEGSPRVILEAMANGINVVSTPVGALPSLFTDGEELLFARFNEDEDFSKKINLLLKDSTKASYMRRKAYDVVQNFTIEKFIKTIFNEN